MIVSYNNVLNTSTLSATNENPNRPVSNLLQNYLQLPFQSTGVTSTITAVLDAEYTIDHVAYGYHNLSDMEIRLYNLVGGLIDTITPVIAANENIHYFTTAVPGVKTIEIDITSAGDAYIGKLFLGEYAEIPNFEQSPSMPFQNRDQVSKSTGGQVAGNAFFVPRQFKVVIPVLDFDENEILIEYIRAVGQTVSHFIDLYPDALDKMPVKFVHLINSETPNDKRRISDWLFTSALTYEEAK